MKTGLLTPATTLRLLAAPLHAEDFVVNINEPFIHFETADGTVTVKSPDDLEGTTVSATRLDGWGITQITGVYRDEFFALAIFERLCEDDIAGIAYSRSALMTLGSATKAGCARLTTEPLGREDG